MGRMRESQMGRKMTEFVRLLTLLTLVAMGWALDRLLSEGNWTVAGGLAVICVGTIFGFNRQLRRAAAGGTPAKNSKAG
jgi:hypothetical protein